MDTAMGGRKEGLKKGDRVKLTDSMAEVAMRGFYLRRRVSVDWHKRRGTVKYTPYPGSACAVVIWDGLTTGDSWPKAALERIEDGRLVNEIPKEDEKLNVRTAGQPEIPDAGQVTRRQRQGKSDTDGRKRKAVVVCRSKNSRQGK